MYLKNNMQTDLLSYIQEVCLERKSIWSLLVMITNASYGICTLLPFILYGILFLSSLSVLTLSIVSLHCTYFPLYSF